MSASIHNHLGNRTRGTLVATVLLGLVSLMPVTARSEDFAEQQQLVDKAKLTLDSFAADGGLKGSIKQLAEDAKGLFIVPQFMRGAFMFGGAGGSGVLIVRDERTGKWSDPLFYNIGSASFGLQVGADVSEIVMVVRTQKGLEGFYTNDFKLGANVGMAVGPVGAGTSAKGITADIVSYAKKKGAFGGIALDGSMVTVSNDSNKAYYGKDVRPTDVIVKKDVGNPKSIELREAAEKLLK
ncbi:lipid-binding SYLF domain-containing protein [Nitrospira sp. BLG_2]|uniref:lipid-binding SYLF domain-containing protein n=1 Tax=Nitrospira sp. BLG_2 TaxID=3397507 RepID=UPI003B9D135F